MTFINKVFDNGGGRATIFVFLVGNLVAGVWFSSQFYLTQQNQEEKITQIKNQVQSLSNIQREVAVNDQRLKSIESSLNQIKTQLTSIQDRME